MSHISLNSDFCTSGAGMKIRTDFFHVAVALINVYIKLFPFHTKAGEYATRIRNLLCSISNEIGVKRKCQPKRCAAKRCQRMKPVVRTLFETDNSDSGVRAPNS